jgi:hypothetical protein
MAITAIRPIELPLTCVVTMARAIARNSSGVATA